MSSPPNSVSPSIVMFHLVEKEKKKIAYFLEKIITLRNQIPNLTEIETLSSFTFKWKFIIDFVESTCSIHSNTSAPIQPIMLRSTRFIGSAPLTRSSAVSNGVKTIIPSLPVRLQSPSTTIPPLQRRTFLTRIFRPPRTEPPPPPPPQPFYGQDELFHPLDQSPILAMRRRAESIKRHAPCPTCITEIQQAASHVVTDSARTADTTATATATVTPTEKPLPKSVNFSCPSCGFPTHCSEGHYLNDTEAHSEFCSRLREINEDEHDLRSGRLISEFELPGKQFLPCSFLPWSDPLRCAASLQPIRTTKPPPPSPHGTPSSTLETFLQSTRIVRNDTSVNC
jgi:hypothetical protein